MTLRQLLPCVLALAWALVPGLRQLLPCVLALAWALVPGDSRAAPSYDACTGFIDSLPATISTPGTWCLRADLATQQTSGNAIAIGNHHVTLDCNNRTLDGLDAGETTQARGIYAKNRAYITVRNCNVRGFAQGIFLDADAPGPASYARIEDNRLDSNRLQAVRVISDDSVVQRNVFTNTGRSEISTQAIAISGQIGRVLDNTIEGVVPWQDESGNANSWGILLTAADEVRRNRIRAPLAVGSGKAYAISVGSGLVIDNQLVGDSNSVGLGIVCTASARAVHNYVINFNTPVQGCTELDNINVPGGA